MKKKDNILRLKYRLELMPSGRMRLEILYQDVKLTNKKAQVLYPDGLELGKFNGWRIASYDNPEIRKSERIIFLCGADKSMKISYEDYFTQNDIDSIHKALEEMVKKVYGNCTVAKG